MMVQAAVLDGKFFDQSSPLSDGCVPAELDVGRGHIVQALMLAVIVAVIDEFVDLVFETAGEIVVS